ncbi:Hypothetical protein, putative [Bodo saltans]|uniref:Exocyst complex component Sec10-like alpha-helical bundle domain-containing protein n=1 Tax=Bodo saltans TaxID=75058 RepID=A0A0S4IRR2_BODSA|nr:Hypothetical protein, putative [Bodo saltans]|eukprot:CUF48674.1 Hypothetical protein, putative [Bodo saltans]
MSEQGDVFDTLSSPQSSGQAPLLLDRSIFTPSSFAAPVLVNAICQRVLMSVPVDTSNMRGGSNFGASTSQQHQDEVPQEVHQNIAGRLVKTLEEAEAQLAQLYAEEQRAVRHAEGDARAIEASKKSLLNQIRVALNDGTSQRIRGMEDAIGNALTSTVGVEQHLNQSNARVTRGRVVSLLLKYFQMFSHIDSKQFEGLLENLSRARAEQRKKTTDQWANGEVSSVDPKYYTVFQRGVDLQQSPSKKQLKSKANKKRRTLKTPDDDEDDEDEESEEDSDDDDVKSKAKKKRRTLKTSDDDEDDEDEESEEDSDDDDDDDDDEDDEERARIKAIDDDIPSPENATVASNKVPLHRFEMVAVSGGLDRLFALRYYTEAQVPWMLKLSVLSRELAAVANNASNIERYLEWLKEELEEDCTHLMQSFRAFYDENGEASVHMAYGKLEEDCTHLMQSFRAFYDENGEASVHMAYGKSLLKTLELSGKLYGSLCVAAAAADANSSAQDDATALLDYVIKKSAQDLVTEMRSSHSPNVPPEQPPLPEITLSTLMAFFDAKTKPGIVLLYNFLEQRVKREALVVESIVAGCFGREEHNVNVNATSAKAKHTPSLSGESQHRRTMSGSLTSIAAASTTGKKSYMHASGTGGGMAASLASTGLTDAGGRQARQQLLYKIMDQVLRRYVTELQSAANQHFQTLLTLLVRERRRRFAARRPAQRLRYRKRVSQCRLEMRDTLLKRRKNLLLKRSTTELQMIFDVIPSLFPHQSEYVSGRQEVSLLQRYMLAIDDTYRLTLLVSAEVNEPFDVKPDQRRRRNTRMEEVCHRVLTLTPPAQVPMYIVDLLSLGIEEVAKYLNAEADKMLKFVKDERSAWNKKPHPRGEEAWISPSPVERQLCAARMIIFAQTTIMRLHEYCASIALQAHLGALSADGLLDFASRSDFLKLDETLEELINLAAAAIVTKSLVILYYSQNKHDFRPKEERKKKGDDDGASVMVVRPSTRACGLFCQYVNFQLLQIQPLLDVSCGQMWRQTVDEVHVPPGGLGGRRGGDGGATPPRSPALGPSAAPTELRVGGDIDRTLTSLRKKSDAVTKVKKMSLQQLIFGDGGPTSLVRSIGVPLYRGLSAHLRQMRCNEAGAFVYKQDVTEYARALRPLMIAPGLDSIVVERLMAVLKDTSGLLLAAVENIKAVKGAGILGELMSNEEKVAYLQMRDDLREGFSQGR